MQIIQHTELTSAQSSITFSSIPQTFTDLYVVLSTRTASGISNDYMTISFNGSSIGFSVRGLFGSGSSVGSFTSPGNYIIESVGNGATSNTFSNGGIYIPNYTSSNNKSYSGDGVGENNATLAYQSITAGLWSNTAAITSISFGNSSSSNFLAGSSATLYGILKGSSGGVTVS